MSSAVRKLKLLLRSKDDKYAIQDASYNQGHTEHFICVTLTSREEQRGKSDFGCQGVLELFNCAFLIPKDNCNIAMTESNADLLSKVILYNLGKRDTDIIGYTMVIISSF
jgi:hypothetical protein